MKIGIVGCGTVGMATARCYLEHAEVMAYDIEPCRRTHNLSEVLEGDLVFVCLPTPMSGDGKCLDTRTLFEFFDSQARSKAKFVLKSTVPIGTTRAIAERRNLDIVHSPEFLTARCAFTDAQIPSQNIIGVPNPSNDPANSLFTGKNQCAQALNILYHTRFAGVPVHLMTSDESEAVKLILNSFFAVKVGFFNEARSLSDKLGLDWDRVLDGVLSDGRIAYSHTTVPGQDGKYGWGGSCLPKDASEFAASLELLGLPNDITLGALKRNIYDRGRNREGDL